MTDARPVLRYFGGKWQLAPWIMSHFPKHRAYVEPFGGGASVLLRKPRSYAEVYNDLHGDVVNVFRVLRDPETAVELERQLRLTPFARVEFDATDDTTADPVERARRLILRSFAGFGSNAINGRTGFRSNSNRRGTTPAHDWMHYPDNIVAFTQRLQGVVIEQRDACEVIQAHDAPETLHYVDPPYVLETRRQPDKNAYAVDMDDAGHVRLAETLHAVTGMVVISGYRCDLYDRLYTGWERRDRMAHAQGAMDRVESLWLNPAAAERTQLSMFQERA